jgi:hypothetical protein
MDKHEEYKDDVIYVESKNEDLAKIEKVLLNKLKKNDKSLKRIVTWSNESIDHLQSIIKNLKPENK